jgi:hypothetical protein
MKLIINLFLFYTLTNSCFAQLFSVTDYRKELNIKLDVIDDKRLANGVGTLNEASSIEAEAFNILETVDDKEKMQGTSSEYNKAIKKFLLASEKYKEGHALIYSVFNENCTKFMDVMRKMNHYAAGMNKAKYYEQKGEKTLEKSLRIREIILEADKPEWIQYKMHEAIELEKLAIRDKGRALQIYQDFPVEYNYGWDDDVTAEELAKIFNNPIVNVPPEKLFTNRVVIDEKEPPIIFRVQIAAHTVKLSDEYIRTFYTGKDTVHELVEGKWYKYQIGRFNNFASADSLRKECRVPRAFVVAYQENKKLTIKKALEKIRYQYR